MLFKILLIIISLLGILVTLFVALKREVQNTPPELKKTEPKVHIKGLLFLETPLEKIQFGYFGLTALIYTALLFTGSKIPWVDLIVLYLSGITFLLLIYNFVMGVGIVKKFSSWVLFCIIFSGVIFGLALLDLEAGLVSLLETARQYNRIIHFLGLVLGLGGTLIVDLMFTHFLQDYRISGSQSVIMHLLSQMIILGLILMILSGIALFLPLQNDLLDSSRFLMKMMVVFIVIINGAALNLYVTPKMKKISLIEKEKDHFKKLKKISFALGAVSIVSWFSAFLLAMIMEFNNFSFKVLFSAYMIMVVISIVVSQFAKKYYEKESEKQKD